MPANPQPTVSLGRGARWVRFFFMHVGSLIAVFVYFHLADQAGYSAEGVRHALVVSLVVMSAYLLLARWRGEVKHADFGLWIMFALGSAGAYAGLGAILDLYRGYSSAILFVIFGLVALVPLLVGFEPFTLYYSRRSAPLWQQKMPSFGLLNRVIAWFWVPVFFAGAVLAAYAPRDPLYTALYPNLLVFLIGIPAPLWLVPLYLKLFPQAAPRSAEGLIMGMPFAFDRKAADGARATFQFHVTGEEPGDYYVQVERGKARSFAGTAGASDVTIWTPDHVWVGLIHGELDGARALADDLYRAEGDLALLARLPEWFHG